MREARTVATVTVLSLASLVDVTQIEAIGLDGVTNPEYKLLRFIQLTIFLQREEGTSF